VRTWAQCPVGDDDRQRGAVVPLGEVRQLEAVAPMGEARQLVTVPLVGCLVVPTGVDPLTGAVDRKGENWRLAWASQQGEDRQRAAAARYVWGGGLMPQRSRR
jgi:hypothetical protein